VAEVLILSSFVSASRVGGLAQVQALARLGHEGILVPTVLFGRRPDLGPPGGARVEPALFDQVIEGVEGGGRHDRPALVLCGYFAAPEQAASAAALIDRMRRENPDLFVLVDTVLGDEGRGLYVRPEVAACVRDQLVPRADLVTPNLWELGWLVGREVRDRADIVPAAKALAARMRTGRVVVTSVPAGEGRIGLIDVAPQGGFVLSHEREAEAPKGAGDLLAALLAAARLDGLGRPDDLARAAGGVADAVRAAARDLRRDLLVTDPRCDFRAPVCEVRTEGL
jgi:pyridoxine kinase